MMFVIRLLVMGDLSDLRTFSVKTESYVTMTTRDHDNT
jgi:hypothetical protein